MARGPTTAEDIARGERLRTLRERLGLTQSQVHKDRIQVIAVEKGRNKLTGGLILPYAEGLGLTPTELVAFRDGQMTVDDAARRSRLGRPPASTPVPPGKDEASELPDSIDRRTPRERLLDDAKIVELNVPEDIRPFAWKVVEVLSKDPERPLPREVAWDFVVHGVQRYKGRIHTSIDLLLQIRPLVTGHGIPEGKPVNREETSLEAAQAEIDASRKRKPRKRPPPKRDR